MAGLPLNSRTHRYNFAQDLMQQIRNGKISKEDALRKLAKNNITDSDLISSIKYMDTGYNPNSNASEDFNIADSFKNLVGFRGLLDAITAKQPSIPDVNIGAATVPVTELSEPSRRELYNAGKILGNSLGNVADSIPSILNTAQTQSIAAASQPAEKQVPVAVAPKGLQKITADIPTTSSEQPRTTNITNAPIPTSAPAVPVQPAEPPIDEHYYRYLRNNGWNDFEARQRAIRYF